MKASTYERKVRLWRIVGAYIIHREAVSEWYIYLSLSTSTWTEGVITWLDSGCGLLFITHHTNLGQLGDSLDCSLCKEEP